MTDVVGIGAIAGRTAWSDWSGLTDGRHAVALWIILHATFDIGLYVGYLRLLGLFIDHGHRTDQRTAAAQRMPARLAQWFVKSRLRPGRLLRSLLWLEITETLLLWVGGLCVYHGAVSAWYPWLVVVVAVAKWVVGGLLILAIALDRKLRAVLGQAVLRAARALKVQRLSFAVVVVLAAFSLVPGRNIWDQLPDVQRSWFAGGASGVVHLLLALVAAGIVGGYLFVLGRQRTERIWTVQVWRPAHRDLESTEVSRATDPEPGTWVWGGWIVTAVVPVAVAVVLAWRKVPGIIDWSLVIVAFGAPALVVLLSLVASLVAKLRGRPLWWEPKLQVERPRTFARDVWATGDILATCVVVFAGLGLVRSLLAPILLGPKDRWGLWFLELAAAAIGGVMAFGAVPWATRFCAWLDLSTRSGSEWIPANDAGRSAFGTKVRKFLSPKDQDSRKRAAFVIVLIAVGWLAVLLVFPLAIAPAVGVVATTGLTLGSWAFLLGFLIVRLQRYKPLPIFRVLRLKATPLLTLLLLFLLYQSHAGGDPDLHQARVSGTDALLGGSARVDLEQSFKQWLDDPAAACTHTANGHVVRPMVLVAASGGGVRAAAWTAGVMDKLRASQPGTSGTAACLHQVFLSSGVSGGSIGLAIARNEPNALEATTKIADEHSLAAAIAGLLVGDMVASASGLRVPSYANMPADSEQPTWHWRDRAGLMETYWESRIPSLARPYDSETTGPGGALLMNSADASSGCRVLVSQVDLATDLAAGSDTASCSGLINQPPASLDLQALYGTCQHRITWATAAMLSARFPTVTPGGRIEKCMNHQDLQLIDGGYADASGLGSLSDIAPQLLEVVRRHNAEVKDDGPFVVPVVLFLEDEARTDIVHPPHGLSTELFVPLAGLHAKDVQASSGTWLQRLATSIDEPCPSTEPDACRAAVWAVHSAVPNGVVIATPVTQPSVEAPLGWTLSQDSINRLTSALDEQATKCPTVRPGGYACLNELLNLLKPAH
ncbi:hypothetical protein AB0E69_19930 [Kribbella sp. NPDC026611]|uniref:hypothetical protein n=1 Tax=Kribbella sp. NPDC026611 TaxID=3154911 RepID=UPI0033DE1A40